MAIEVSGDLWQSSPCSMGQWGQQRLPACLAGAGEWAWLFFLKSWGQESGRGMGACDGAPHAAWCSSEVDPVEHYKQVCVRAHILTHACTHMNGWTDKIYSWCLGPSFTIAYAWTHMCSHVNFHCIFMSAYRHNWEQICTFKSVSQCFAAGPFLTLVVL